ncbi:MAG: PAP2 family protein [Parcubacteria group bacterium GW2011_GWF2_38_76]|nr:MAG: PAP2 family protein [Parcubacteria group bacterium GW2011_GWF2_38_76]HBM45582.1 glycerol acyltransferase [Patescibacteria group bacterium]
MKIFDNKKLFIFILTLISVGFVYGNFVYQLDFGFDNLLSGIRTPALLSFFGYITLLGDKYFIVILGVILSYLIYRFWTKDTFLLKIFWVALILNMISGFLIKYFVGRDRPLGAEIYEGYTYSFPSGHSLAALFVYGFIAVLVLKTREINIKKRYASAIFSALIILLIGFSRLYLGVHYLSDVVGGYFVGWFWLNFLVSFLKDIEREKDLNTVKVAS